MAFGNIFTLSLNGWRGKEPSRLWRTCNNNQVGTFQQSCLNRLYQRINLSLFNDVHVPMNHKPDILGYHGEQHGCRKRVCPMELDDIRLKLTYSPLQHREIRQRQSLADNIYPCPYPIYFNAMYRFVSRWNKPRLFRVEAFPLPNIYRYFLLLQYMDSSILKYEEYACIRLIFQFLLTTNFSDDTPAQKSSICGRVWR